jgi:hypothetical protein
MTLVLSFDPGKNHGGRNSGSGWCLQDENTVYDFGVTQDLVEFLAWDVFAPLKKLGIRPDIIVYEGYQIRKETVAQNVGIPLSTVENIGAIKLFARSLKAEVVKFMPAQKPTQWKATGKNPTKVPKAQSHWIDAYNHGRYYLITRNLAPSALEEEIMKGQ